MKQECEMLNNARQHLHLSVLSVKQGVKEMQKRVMRMLQIIGSDRTDSRDCWALLDHKIPIVGLGLGDTKTQNSNQQ